MTGYASIENYGGTLELDGIQKERPMKPEYSKEFWYWYERCFCQSPNMCQLKYDDEKMWEAWQAGYKQGRDNAFARKDCPPEIFTIPKEKHVHSMKGNNEDQAKMSRG